MLYKIISLSLLILTLGCKLPDINKDSDYTVVTANILITNENGKKEIADTLLRYNADIYLLHEAVININVDQLYFESKGYKVFSHIESSHNGFNGVLLAKLEGAFTPIQLSYFYGNDEVVTPYYSLETIISDKKILFIGAHVPPEILMPSEVKALREDAITDIAEFIINKRKEGYEVILGGDLNTFPSDTILNPLFNAGLNDSVLKNPDKYDTTWSPMEFIPGLARIDYIFHTKGFSVKYQNSFKIPGSDHKGVVIGVNI